MHVHANIVIFLPIAFESLPISNSFVKGVKLTKIKIHSYAKRDLQAEIRKLICASAKENAADLLGSGAFTRKTNILKPLLWGDH